MVYIHVNGIDLLLVPDTSQDWLNRAVKHFSLEDLAKLQSIAEKIYCACDAVIVADKP